MIKRKMQHREEVKQNNINKTSENKENTHKQENNTTKKSKIPDSDELKESSSESIAGAEVADKVVIEEKSVEEKLAEMQDKYIRLSAEFDNYRKRTLREKMEISKYAGENLLLNVIPIMDDFERAIKHMDTATDCATMKNGIDLISRGAPALDAHSHQFTDAFAIDRHERIGRQDSALGVKAKEA